MRSLAEPETTTEDTIQSHNCNLTNFTESKVCVVLLTVVSRSSELERLLNCRVYILPSYGRGPVASQSLNHYGIVLKNYVVFYKNLYDAAD